MIKIILKDSPMFEGTNIQLKRAFGYADESFYPFLLLDDFHSDDP